MKIIRNIAISFVLVLILVWSSGCQKYPFLEGNGNVVTEIRQSVSFNRIENKGEFYVYYKYDSTFRVEVEAESNLIPYIRTVVNGNTLEIDSRENLSSSYAMKVTVYSPVLVGVELSGSGLVNVQNAVSGTFNISLSGSGNIYGDVNTSLLNSNLSGSGEIDFHVTTNNIVASISGSGKTKLVGHSYSGDYKISGSGYFDAYNLILNDCYIKISGSGSVYTTVSDILSVKISGSGDVHYVGNHEISSSITGSGRIIKE